MCKGADEKLAIYGGAMIKMYDPAPAICLDEPVMEHISDDRPHESREVRTKL